MSVASAVDSESIEKAARGLQMQLWDRQCCFWPGQKVTPLDACDPWVAAHHLGFEVQEGWLDSEGSRAGRYQLGGFLNRQAKLIGISDQQKPRTQRFTLAHELGHVLMHPGIHHHRELPLAGITEPHEAVEPKERQANHFAGCFLVPAKQLRLAFRASFGVEHLTPTDEVAYELLGAGFKSLLNSPYESLHFERLVAQAVRFRGRHFSALNDLFQVSATTLAIRLRQARLTGR